MHLRQYSFFNNVTQAIELKEPPPLRGGIVADPMGLGKTLTMIALTATDLEPQLYSSTWPPNQGLNTKTWTDATLIIVPPPREFSLRNMNNMTVRSQRFWTIKLIEIQSYQHGRSRCQSKGHLSSSPLQQGTSTVLSVRRLIFGRHTFENAMRIRLHYGREKLDDSVELKNTHIVLTTYHTVSAEWKSRKGQERSVLFSSHWKRIILDEGMFQQLLCTYLIAHEY